MEMQKLKTLAKFIFVLGSLFAPIGAEACSVLNFTEKDKAETPKEVLFLINKLEQIKYPETFLVIKRLGDLKNEKAIPALLRILKGDNHGLGQSAASALGKIGGPPCLIEKYLEMLEERDFRVSSGAVEVLGVLKDPKTVPALLKALKHPKPHISRNATSVLREIKPPYIVPELITLFQNEKTHIRANAISILSLFKSPKILELLNEALNDKNESVVFLAIVAIGNSKYKEAAAGLKKFLNHEKWELKISAARSLAKMQDKSAFPILVEDLKHKNGIVRERAISFLAILKDPRAIPHLISLYKTDEYSRRYIVKALREFDDETVRIFLKSISRI